MTLRRDDIKNVPQWLLVSEDIDRTTKSIEYLHENLDQAFTFEELLDGTHFNETELTRFLTETKVDNLSEKRGAYYVFYNKLSDKYSGFESKIKDLSTDKE
jgi:hypothetical protein